MSKSNPFLQFASKVSLKQMLQEQREAIIVLENDPMNHALALMKKHHTLSLPVLALSHTKKGDNHPHDEFRGIVSVFDIARAFILAVQQSGAAQQQQQQHSTLEHVLQRTVTHLLSLPQDDTRSLWVYDADETLFKAAELFGLGVQRILVTSPTSAESVADESKDAHKNRLSGHSVKVLSQSDFVRGLLYMHLSDQLDQQGPISKIFHASLQQLSMPVDINLVTIPASTTALGAFEILVSNNLNAAPVINDQGVIQAAFSSSDVRQIDESNINRVFLSVLEYLKIHPDSDHEDPEKKIVRAPITCHAQDKLGDVLQRMVQAAVHHVWIVDQDNKPKGLVGLSDVIFLFTEGFPHHL